MNEKLIDQVLQIEKQAQEIHEAARREAEQLPLQAEKEAQALIEKARAEAEEEARQLIAGAQSQEESARTLGEAEEKARQLETLAMGNLDLAVAYVLERVAGRA
jgi:cell division septum initiation protein DivIVA